MTADYMTAFVRKHRRYKLGRQCFFKSRRQYYHWVFVAYRIRIGIGIALDIEFGNSYTELIADVGKHLVVFRKLFFADLMNASNKASPSSIYGV